jgi:hypothetical protein
MRQTAAIPIDDNSHNYTQSALILEVLNLGRLQICSGVGVRPARVINQVFAPEFLTKELLTYVCPEGLVPPTFTRRITREKSSFSRHRGCYFTRLCHRRRRGLDGFNFVGSGCSPLAGRKDQLNSGPEQ